MKIYENKNHTIYHGDALEVLKSEIKSNSVDLIFVDPPYNIGKIFSEFKDCWASNEAYTAWAYQWIDECVRVLKPMGTMYLMTSTQAMPYFDIYIRDKLEVVSRIIWSYDSSGVQAKKHYGSMYEPILHCVKDPKSYCFNADEILVEAKTGAKRKLIDYRGDAPKLYSSDKVPGNVWEFPRVRYRMHEYEKHPSQKPEALLNRIVRASSNKGDTILDPFSGTFTTAAVAKNLERKSISIESQDEYLKIGLRRVLEKKEHLGEKLEAVNKNTKIKNGCGKKYDDKTAGFFNVNY